MMLSDYSTEAIKTSPRSILMASSLYDKPGISLGIEARLMAHRKVWKSDGFVLYQCPWSAMIVNENWLV